MIEIIAGEKGKGKTKELIAKVNKDIQSTNGHIIYLDKNSKHMFELNNRIRLINVFDYPVTNTDMFLGFIAGTVSTDHDVDFVLSISMDQEQLPASIRSMITVSL